LGEERKVTLITAAHTLSLLPNLAHRTVDLKSGRIVFDESIDAIDHCQLQQLYETGGSIAAAPHTYAGANRVVIP
jgi:ABC-type phosphate/phosphonate transport system ATPase subunit